MKEYNEKLYANKLENLIKQTHFWNEKILQKLNEKQKF